MQCFASRLLPALLVLLVPATFSPAQVQGPPAYEKDPEFQRLKLEAQKLEHNPSYLTFVTDAWKKANVKAGGHCMECSKGMVLAATRLGDGRHAIQFAHEMDAAAERTVDHVSAKLLLGQATLALINNRKPDEHLLQEAHKALQEAEPAALSAYFYDGRVLSLLHQDEAAAASFRAYAEKTRQDDTMLARAQHFAARPELARMDMAPAMAFTTLAGKHFNLDAMNGRVVLIDFWSTWCGPCKQELPHLKKLAAQYANQPFELISISWDDDETAWKQYVAANGMTWNQYRDADHSLANLFGINSIPHFFTIDANGVLAAEDVGSGSNLDGRIRKLVAQAREPVPSELSVRPSVAGE